MMNDVLNIVDVVVGTPLGTSDHCCVSRGLHGKQSVPEYMCRSSVFLKHHTKCCTVRCAVRSFTWSTILKSADPLVAFDRAICGVIGRYVPIPLFCEVDLETSNGLMPAAGELMMINRCLSCLVEHVMLNIGVNMCLLVLRPRGLWCCKGIAQ